MNLQARVAAITQSVMAWHIARDCEINFNGRGNDSEETGCFGEKGCHLRVQVLVPSLPQALAPVSLNTPPPMLALPPVEVLRPALYKPRLGADPGVKHGQA